MKYGIQEGKENDKVIVCVYIIRSKSKTIVSQDTTTNRVKENWESKKRASD